MEGLFVIIVKCSVCGKEIERNNYEVKHNKTNIWYCSDCDPHKKNKIKTYCLTCGKEINITPSQVKRNRGKYCSKECHHLSEVKKINTKCLTCNREFKVLPSEIKKGYGKYCSKKCCHLSKFFREKLSNSQKGKNNSNFGKKGELSPHWKGGITNASHKVRTSFEYKEWRKLVFERDNYTCQKCGKRGKKLNAHHIESFNNNPDKRILIDNGITLCQTCHKNFHHQYGYISNTQKQLTNFLQQLISNLRWQARPSFV